MPQISVWLPSSITRFGGMLKKSVAASALRCILVVPWIKFEGLISTGFDHHYCSGLQKRVRIGRCDRGGNVACRPRSRKNLTEHAPEVLAAKG
jgi:hypothetical protein